MADRTYGGFTTAIVREIPGSLAGDAAPPAEGEERENAVQAVDLQKARDEWTTYVDTLRTLGLRVITIPADEECPGCAFVADTAVVVDGIAFITRPTNPDRRKELKAVKEVLEAQLGVGNVAELRDIEATLDGRDVLFTGREFFVRVTESNNNAPQSPTRRTTRKKEKPAPKNDAGARLLARVFPDFQVTSLYIQGDRPLQSYLSMAGPDIIAAGEGEDAQRVIEQIIEKAEYKYKVLCLPEDSAVDCVFVNGSLVHRTQEEIPKSTEVIEAKLTDLKKVIVPNSELAKVGATLSALTVFI
ncbi:N(G),N(G)-dimethylarginine dimethylaminohydrolase 1-like [Branchiostoma floridae x Branchiostoma belcheri]